jgi:hypothetical protein
MKYIKEEARDFKCRSCGANWLNYIEDRKPCNNSDLEDGGHNFDFGKPIRKDSGESESGRPAEKVHREGKIIFQ